MIESYGLKAAVNSSQPNLSILISGDASVAGLQKSSASSVNRGDRIPRRPKKKQKSV